jgi:hypothetical protein
MYPVKTAININIMDPKYMKVSLKNGILFTLHSFATNVVAATQNVVMNNPDPIGCPIPKPVLPFVRKCSYLI